VHDDDRAGALARASGGAALTVGNHILIDRAQAPRAPGGRDRLLAPEVAHVAQQAATGVAALHRAPPTPPAAAPVAPSWLNGVASPSHVQGGIWEINVNGYGPTYVGPYTELTAYLKQIGWSSTVDAHHIVGGEHLGDVPTAFAYENAPAVALHSPIHSAVSDTITREQGYLGGRATRTSGRPEVTRGEVVDLYRAVYDEDLHFTELATISENVLATAPPTMPAPGVVGAAPAPAGGGSQGAAAQPDETKGGTAQPATTAEPETAKSATTAGPETAKPAATAGRTSEGTPRVGVPESTTAAPAKAPAVTPPEHVGMPVPAVEPPTVTPASQAIIKEQVALFAELEAETASAVRFASTVRLMSTIAAEAFQALDMLNAVDSILSVAASGTVFPDQQKQAEAIERQGRDAVKWANAAWDALPILVSIAVISDAKQRGDTETLFDIGSKAGDFWMSVDDHAWTFADIGRKARAYSEAQRVMSDVFYKMVEVPQGVTTAPNAQELGIAMSLEKLSGTLASAASSYEEAARLAGETARWADGIATEANHSAWAIIGSELARAQKAQQAAGATPPAPPASPPAAGGSP
jgi:hypothetical protein